MKSKKVLIVDNNDLSRKLFESLVGQLSRFESAKNGIEAVGKASQNQFDLILMNIQLPNMDGVTASKMIWRQTGQHCPIIAITAAPSNVTKEYYVEKGFDDLIKKPICPQEFLELISSKIRVNSEFDAQTDSVIDKKVLTNLLKFNSMEIIKSIYTDFIEEFDQLIGLIDIAFAEKNQAELIGNLHTIKGNSGSLGAKAIFTISSEADINARALDWDSLENAINNLKNERIILERYLEEETTFKL